MDLETQFILRNRRVRRHVANGWTYVVFNWSVVFRKKKVYDILCVNFISKVCWVWRFRNEEYGRWRKGHFLMKSSSRFHHVESVLCSRRSLENSIKCVVFKVREPRCEKLLYFNFFLLFKFYSFTVSDILTDLHYFSENFFTYWKGGSRTIFAQLFGFSHKKLFNLVVNNAINFFNVICFYFTSKFVFVFSKFRNTSVFRVIN